MSQVRDKSQPAGAGSGFVPAAAPVGGSSDRPAGVGPPDAPDVPAWDDAPLAQEIFLLNNLMQRVADRLVGPKGLTCARWMLLGALEHFDRPPSLSELASDGLMSPQNVSKLVADLAADGFVERFSVRGMGRTVFVRTTERGDAICERTEHEACAFVRWFLDGVTDQEIEVLRRLLVKLIRNTRAFEQAMVSDGVEAVIEKSNGGVLPRGDGTPRYEHTKDCAPERSEEDR